MGGVVFPRLGARGKGEGKRRRGGREEEERGREKEGRGKGEEGFAYFSSKNDLSLEGRFKRSLWSFRTCLLTYQDYRFIEIRCCLSRGGIWKGKEIKNKKKMRRLEKKGKGKSEAIQNRKKDKYENT